MLPRSISTIDVEPAEDAAADAFILCFPLLLMDAVRRAHPLPTERFYLIKEGAAALSPGLAEDDPRIVVLSAWIDLAAGPVIVTLPHAHGRHLSLTLIDTCGAPFASVGTRSGDDTGLDLALVGPGWTGAVRRGLHARRSTSNGCWAIARIHGHSRFDRIEALQIARRFSIMPMFDDLQRKAPPLAELEPQTTPLLDQVAEIAPALFLHRLQSNLDRAPLPFVRAHRRELSALSEKLGEAMGGMAAQSDGRMEAIKRGLADGLSAIQAAANRSSQPSIDGWRVKPGPPRTDSDRPLANAARALLALGAPPEEELLTLECDSDMLGAPLSGDRVYRLRFDRNGLPPVQGYWRLQACPAPPDCPPGLGSRSDLRVEPDGSLEILVQAEEPRPEALTNWLPTSPGRFTLVAYLNAPSMTALSGAWRMPAIEPVARPLLDIPCARDERELRPIWRDDG